MAVALITAVKLRIRVIPPSSAKLTDLDQIVALVIALVWFCGARVRQLYSEIWKWLRANH